MKSKVNELSDHISKIENGSITLPELEYSVDVARELYERLIVVRHKVYEGQILEKPTIDLSPIAFDEEINDETTSAETKIIIENTEQVENEIFVEETKIEAETTQAETEVEEFSFEVTSTEEESKDEEETLFELGGNKTEISNFEDDLEQAQPEIITHMPATEPVSSGSWIGKIKEIEDHIPASFTMSKLDTLMGSFGLNERLQFINELFGGSSETFSEAVKILDARTGIDSAREKIAEFAENNNWDDADPETISDFVAKIKRRYA